MAGKGLKNDTESKTIQASCGIAYAVGNIHPVFCLMTDGNVFLSLDAGAYNVL